MADEERIIKINIEEEMQSAYIDYSMSVIVSRALPDVRDGLKPVHRRVLFGMHDLGMSPSKPYKKSARIVGEVLGKYHPHGDSSVYHAMVRMAQPWSMRYMLVDGQGNMGSVDGDSPAAMRYTEARMNRLSEEMLADIEKNTVDFQYNFDDSLKEPTVLPTRIPALLVNGTSGIAVGMATNMAPHNLGDAINAIVAYIDNPDISIEELIKVVQAPDFPTGGTIYGYLGVKEGYETGRGRIVIRAKSEIETENNGREKIIITEIPYMVNKADLIVRIADLVNDKKIDGISNVNDESDRDGMRIVIDLKKEAIANVVLNHLYKYTALQSSFGVNNIALVKGRPQLLNIKGIVQNFVEHRHDVVTRRTQFELDQAEKRAHILEGLIIASDNIDEVIKIIRAAQNPDEAREKLMERFELSDIQSRAIVEMRLRQLTGLEQDKLRSEYDALLLEIDRLKEILAAVELRMEIIKNEMLEIKRKYNDPRRTEIVYSSEEFNPEDFYADEQMIITISHLGYIKRTPLAEFRTQNRGGVGSKGSTTRDEDFIEHIYPASMHNTMLFFTKLGRCFWLKVYEIPEGTKNSKGRAIQNLLQIDPEDTVKAFIRVKKLNDEEYCQSHHIVMGTKKGVIKKSLLVDYSRPRQSGVIAISIREDDELIQARLTNGNSEILMATRSGRAIRFNESHVRSIGRTGQGVRGITLDSKVDEVVGMVCVKDTEDDIMVVSEKGYGKRSNLDDYRVTNRGGKGVKTMRISEKTGDLITIKSVNDDNDLMIINRSGVTIRVAVADLRTTGRATQGVRLINLDKKHDMIASVTKVISESKMDEDIMESGILEKQSDDVDDDNDGENS
ncbi:DNA gyrase subunit A [Marinilabilia sp.]|uniref:DNA gyrase subunit A n=1 Tax=Marinilabilia sp. TaxID=2021252 RepID=UPI0025B9A2D4|nr:DNA gyrase subunit A [Marinilabilia sp.]